jgi:hypothetical protein
MAQSRLGMASPVDRSTGFPAAHDHGMRELTQAWARQLRSNPTTLSKRSIAYHRREFQQPRRDRTCARPERLPKSTDNPRNGRPQGPAPWPSSTAVKRPPGAAWSIGNAAFARMRSGCLRRPLSSCTRTTAASPGIGRRVCEYFCRRVANVQSTRSRPAEIFERHCRRTSQPRSDHTRHPPGRL